MPTAPAGSQGVLGRPTLATAEKGRVVFERWVAAVVGVLARKP
jgi:creatinine amidohydrolase/Fe(II)-dependent formamide hydrolase-like protein